MVVQQVQGHSYVKPVIGHVVDLQTRIGMRYRMRHVTSCSEFGKAEVCAGNVLAKIFRNNDRGIIPLAFKRGLLSDGENVKGIVVRSRLDAGNYNYD